MFRSIMSVVRTSDDKSLKHPLKVSEYDWDDNMKKWPDRYISFGNIFNYCVVQLGLDGEKMENYKGFESYQYFHSNKVGRVMLHSPD